MYTRRGKLFDPHRSKCIGLDGADYTGIVLQFPLIVEQEQIVEIPDPQPPEGYVEDEWFKTEDWQTETGPYIIYTRRPQEMIDAQNQGKLNATSLAYLNSTDWYTVRFAETGEAIPEDIKLARQAARDAIVKQETPI